MTTAGLTDDAARDRIAQDTAHTLFVEAGAGSGKTRSLTERVVTLVMADQIPLSEIAAVTFTEKAGAELRDRLRAGFEKAWRDGRLAGDRADAQRAAEALDALDAAAIGTLHSFAQRILATHPIEAGLPPLVEVMDEVASSVAFDERWSVIQRRLLDDGTVSQPLLLAMAAGVPLDKLRSLTRALGDNWDLIEDRVLPGGPPKVELPDPETLIDRAALLAARAVECADPADLFFGRLTDLGSWAAKAAAIDDEAEVFAHLSRAEALKLSYGRKPNWRDLDGLRADCRQWQAEVAAMTSAFADATLRPLAYWLAERVHEAAGERAAEGRLEFHDLLVLARRLLRVNADVRAALHRRYRVLLLDEFQDTDPIQLELAVRIAGGRAADGPTWADVRVPAGSLFVVGDPKQSIYRFRRASIGTYLQAEEWFGDTVSLTTNFRTVAPLLDWVNHVFSQLIQPAPEAQPAYQSLDPFRRVPGAGASVTVLGPEPHADGPNAERLREREAADVAAAIANAMADGWTVWDEVGKAWRPIRLGDIAILLPARTSLPFLEDALEAAGIPYAAESSSLVYQAGEVRDLLAAARTLADPTDLLSCVTALRSALFGCGDDDLWEHKRQDGSFSILAPSATGAPDAPASPVSAALDYLRRLHFAARWMSPSEVLGRLIEDRRMLEVAAAGKRPRDVWRRLRFVVDQARAWSESEHGGLRGYLAWAARQGEDASRAPQAILPETDVDAVRVMTIHAAKGLEFPMVVLSGLSAAPRTPSGVRVRWPSSGGFEVKLTKTMQTNDFEALTPLDEQMDDLERRRLLYVATTRARDHLVVSLHRKPAGRGTPTSAQLLATAGATEAGALPFTAPVDVARPPSVMPRVTAPPEWSSWLAGVTAARAASRLPGAVTPSGLEGTEPRGAAAAWPPDDSAETTAAGTIAATDGAAADAPANRLAHPAGYPSGYPSGDAVRAEDVQAADVRAADLRPGDVGAEDVKAAPPGLAKGARDLELPPWSKGRYGTNIGRAVHGVLQSIDLTDGAGIDDAVLAQCVTEGVLPYADVVHDLVSSALASPVVQRAAARGAWRESWVATVEAGPVAADPAGPPDGTVLEGIIDLMYREEDGSVVIVDYKTDAIPAAALQVRADFYGPQIRAYARAVRAATGAAVSGTLLFLHPQRPAVAIEVAV